MLCSVVVRTGAVAGVFVGAFCVVVSATSTVANETSLAPKTVAPDAPFCFSLANYGIGNHPVRVVAADVDGDGFLDVAVRLEAGVELLLNNGDGTFGPAAGLSVGGVSYGLASDDLDANGTTDLVFTGESPNEVSVLLGNGDGTFQPVVDYPLKFRFPNAIVIGDYNRDAILDLAVANYGPDYEDGTVSILLGRGDGTFHEGVDFAAGVNPIGLGQGDFNRDGQLDLAVPNNNGEQGILILVGNGDGSFQPPVRNAVLGGNPRGPAVGDFNRDGKLDLAVGTFQFPSGISVLLGHGDGTFDAAVHYIVEGGLGDVTAGDLNGDGVLDLATANTSGTVSILVGREDGTFGEPQYMSVGSFDRGKGVAIADLNNDRRNDIAATPGDSVVSVLLACPTGGPTCGPRQTLVRTDRKVCPANDRRPAIVRERACCEGANGKVRCRHMPHCPRP